MKIKKILFVFLSLIVITGFTACGNKPTENPDSSEAGNTATPDSSEAGNSSEDVSENVSSEGESSDSEETSVSESASSREESSSVISESQSTASSTPAESASESVNEDNTMEELFEPYINETPRVVKMTDYNPISSEWSNIEAITYDGAEINGKKTKIFAYIGFPEGASALNKVPAIVLVHGGGGHSYAEWIKLWTNRGYAAIAMDNTGFFPSEAGKGIAGHEADGTNLWNFGLYGAFAENGYVGIPNNDEVRYPNRDAEDQWMYHAIISTFGAHNVLAADERVDSSKIGITGISWGGVITSLAIGYDTSYAFAIPVYGSGYLDEALSWMGPIFANPLAKKLWSAADRFDNVNMPVLWLGWSVDTAFSINSNSKSYDDTKSKGGVLSMIYAWAHSHGQGWKPQEAFQFADWIVKSGPSMTSVVAEPEGRDVSFTINPASDAIIVKARAIYITDTLSYTSKNNSWPTMDQTWKAKDCTVDGNTVTVSLPTTVKGYYIELQTTTPAGKFITTSRFVTEFE